MIKRCPRRRSPRGQNIRAREWFKAASRGAHRPQGAPEGGGCHYPSTTETGRAAGTDFRLWLVVALICSTIRSVNRSSPTLHAVGGSSRTGADLDASTSDKLFTNSRNSLVTVVISPQLANI